MKIEFIAIPLFVSTFFLMSSCSAQDAYPHGGPTPDSHAQFVPIGGNTWQLPQESRQTSFLGERGVNGWDDTSYFFQSYIRFADKGKLRLWLSLESDSEDARVSVAINGETKEVHIPADFSGDVFAGTWAVTDTGYAMVTLRGIDRGGVHFPRIGGYRIDGSAVSPATAYVKNNTGDFFYWGRRGPSVHLNYRVPADKAIKWYYNEITVPEGDDVVGSYYMANGFRGGYFGIQVNSEIERRILFSVWSPYETDNPDEIPEAQQIKLLRKGADVHTGEFGNEGSGGQSYLRYPWKAGHTYRFLLSGEPVGNNHTVYTAWFFAPEKGEWMLIASFSRPDTDTWLEGFHSFLENFSPQQGRYERRVFFGNQWVADRDGNWYEITAAKFTADNTARVGYRLDYGGGEAGNRFFLRNCGFFADYTVIDTFFERTAEGKQPTVDLSRLP